MLHILNSLTETQERALMDIYRESNEDNVAYFYPDCRDLSEGRARVERDFCFMLREAFFGVPGNRYFVLEADGVWVSALRIYPVEDFYWLEALETHPEYRRRGYAVTLLRQTITALAADGPVCIRDGVRKTNTASLRTHEKAGFVIEHEDEVTYLPWTVDPATHEVKTVPHRVVPSHYGMKYGG